MCIYTLKVAPNTNCHQTPVSYFNCIELCSGIRATFLKVDRQRQSMNQQTVNIEIYNLTSCCKRNMYFIFYMIHRICECAEYKYRTLTRKTKKYALSLITQKCVNIFVCASALIC